MKEEEEKEREEEEEQEEEVVELLDSADEFEVFNQPQSPEVTSDNMGIQRKSQRNLLDVIEGQPGKGAPGKSVQTNLPPPPPLQLSQPQGIEPTDPKRRRESKDKEVVEIGRSRPTSEDEVQRAAK